MFASVHTSIQLLSLFHTSILRSSLRHQSSNSTSSPALKPHTRYTTNLFRTSSFYTHTANLLQTIQYTELLAEMIAKRRGEKLRWRVVVILEAIKAICRIILVGISGRRMVLAGQPLPDRPPIPSEGEEGGGDAPAIPGQAITDAKPWIMPRTSLKLANPPEPNSRDISAYLLAHTLTPNAVVPPSNLLSKLSTSRTQAAELLWILRPVIYALLMQRFRRNKRDWRPWVAGVTMEFAARQMATVPGRQGGSWNSFGRMGELAKEEWSRRGRQLWWWGLRGAAFEGVTKGWLKGLEGKLKGKMVLDLAGGLLEDYEWLWGEYYFATASE